MELFAPEEYKKLTPEARKKISNGCGPGGKGFLVPNMIWFLSIKEACDIHDYMYHVGETLEDKMEADRVFLNNMLRIINTRTNKPMRYLRQKRAMKYYSAVSICGGPAFWDGKNITKEEG